MCVFACVRMFCVCKFSDPLVKQLVVILTWLGGGMEGGGGRVVDKKTKSVCVCVCVCVCV